ncbi:MAG: exo-alpha-sialidase [bacterium]|nr:exo-alpha-sialidase [bacterium]
MLGLTLSALAADDIAVTQVIGREFPGKYKHPASITELNNGDLYVAYYGGGGEYEGDSKVWGLRRRAGQTAWTTPEVIADTPFLAEGNPVLWQAPDGLVWLFYVQRYGDTWSDSRIKGKISSDGAKTWSDSFMVAFEKGMMVRSRPILLSDGDYLLGVYHETGGDRENVGDDTSSLFLRFKPKTRTWSQSNKIYSRTGNLQPSPVEITDDYLVSYSRRGGGYGPVDDGYLVRSESRDGGRTWSRGKDSAFPNPNAATDFIKLHNGHLMLVYNHSMNDRTPLTVAISTDNDKSYPHRRHIGEGENSFAYPVAIQTRDGRLHVLYTTNERSTVMLASFDESAILGHT